MRWMTWIVVLLVSATACSSDDDATPNPERSDAAPVSSESGSGPSPESTSPATTGGARTTDGNPPPGTATAAPPPADSTDDSPDPSTFGELGGTDATITGDRGTLQLGDVDIPEELPGEFPLPGDLAIVLASEVDDSVGFTGETDLAFDDVVDFYRSGLPDAGYDVDETQFVADVVAVMAFGGPEGSGDVVVSAGPGGVTTVIVTFES
jgi:hypothetical protein